GGVEHRVRPYQGGVRLVERARRRELHQRAQPSSNMTEHVRARADPRLHDVLVREQHLPRTEVDVTGGSGVHPAPRVRAEEAPPAIAELVDQGRGHSNPLPPRPSGATTSLARPASPVPGPAPSGDTSPPHRHVCTRSARGRSTSVYSLLEWTSRRRQCLFTPGSNEARWRLSPSPLRGTLDRS